MNKEEGAIMKVTFFKNISRIRLDLRKMGRAIWKLNLAWKVMLLLTLFMAFPFLGAVMEINIMAVVPLVGSLLFVKDEFEGRKRGLLGFALGSVSQLLALSMVMNLLPSGVVTGPLGFETVVTATLTGLILLIPGYALAYLFYGLDYKKADGKIYFIMFGLLGIIIGVWNAIAVYMS